VHVLLNVREFWRSMITVLSQWEPLLFRGAADVAAFYKTRPVFCPSGQPKSGCSILLRAKLVWVLFWAVAKECLARRATTAMLNEKYQVNANHQNQKKTNEIRETNSRT